METLLTIFALMEFVTDEAILLQNHLRSYLLNFINFISAIITSLISCVDSVNCEDFAGFILINFTGLIIIIMLILR